LPCAFAFAVQNACVAAATARALGVSLADIAASLSRAVVPGRMECVYAACGRQIYVDCCFDPQDLARALQALAPLTKGRLCVLLGSVGGRAKARRGALSRMACRHADHIYLTADDPDFEDPAAICREMLACMDEPDRAEIIPDREQAVLRAVRDMRRGDVLLLAGKGGVAYQLIRGMRMPLDERALCLRGAEYFS
jgi:UDP-N-acetylmuramyl tripeptide synthase